MYDVKIEYKPEPTEIWEMYGGYRMCARYCNDNYAQVAMYDLGEWIPMVWSKGMTWKQADGARELFKAIGYFDMPIDTE